ncbi:GrpB family protein [Paenarthrobacter sp. NPDC092416]|uniref:GrpB family protein n=1 Tax=Paenarthrobacter sp. NPDC092416 TaxID=3364386 RepID=UPI00380078DD
MKDSRLLDAVIAGGRDREAFIVRAQRFDQRRRDHQLPSDLPPAIAQWSPVWAETAGRIEARIELVFNSFAVKINHIGSTAVKGLPAKAIIDLQVSVERLEDCDSVDAQLRSAGLVNVQDVAPDAPGVSADNPRGLITDPALWAKRLYASVDEERRVIVHVRRIGSPGWRYAFLFRDWLRADDQARDDYAAVKKSLAATHAADTHFDAYAKAKDYWFANAYYLSEQWAKSTNWDPEAAPKAAP